MTVNQETCRIYESAALRKVGDGLIRPGGLELTRKALSLAALPPGSFVLDIGCGTGVSLNLLVDECGFHAVGIDHSMLLLEDARRRNPLGPFARASGACLPLADSALDAILAECSLSVMEDVDMTLEECFRVMKHGGLLLIHDVYARAPDGAQSLRGLPIRSCLTGAVSEEEWIERLERHGFSVLHWQDHTHALKEFAARLIFSYGSLEAFWGCARGTAELGAGQQIHHAITLGRPGYFFVMARKTGHPSCKEQLCD